MTNAKRKKTPLTYKNLKSRIGSELRWLWMTQWEPRKEVIRRTRIGDSNVHICEQCHKAQQKSEMEVHHIIPIKSDSWDERIKKEFVSADKMMHVCVECHFILTYGDDKHL